VKRLVGSAVGAGAARAVLDGLRRHPRAAELDRTNFHGRTVSLAGGPALAAGASLGAALAAPGGAAAAAAATAGLLCGAVGAYDDVVGARPEQKAAKGFAGHLAALRDGHVTSGLVKIVGVGAAGLAAAALLDADPRRRAGGRRPVVRVAHVLLGAGVVAGTANLLNLLDLRPGRAIKAGALIAVPLSRGPAAGLATAPCAAAAALLEEDLDEEIMLGDAGANAFGALLGVAIAARTGPGGRAAVLAVLAALTAASERVSFTQVIQRTPGLRELDALGRRP
jgi:UDP-N-acetylmuramyl pentapeptide phosphotransferase/UDP-N-acetylglucosamine-1-phosphate transferase